jgi:D-sedoheptulose 7-phosphate isomerase
MFWQEVGMTRRMIETVLLDIDGVLTDGMVYVNAEGKETKRVSFEDIDAVFALKRNGIKIGFITGEEGGFAEYVKQRFSPDFFVSGCKDKLGYFKTLEQKEGLDKSKTCFVGDSIKDAELLRYVAYSMAPCDVDENVREAARQITSASRGKGVVKEVAQFVLEATEDPTDQNGLWKLRAREHMDLIRLLVEDQSIAGTITEAARMIIAALKSGGKLLVCGNGGSAADSQHLAAELVGRFAMNRKGLNVEALTVDTSVLTALANDYSFRDVFSRQVEAKGKAGDVLLAISTSGNSPNVVEATKTAKSMGIKTIGLTGNNEVSSIRSLSDRCICVPSGSIPRIQETHILIGHVISELVERGLFGKGG